METIMSEESYLFVIDTNSYAGNFEREMCAYCTGQIGVCEVGEELAQLFHDEEMTYDFGDYGLEDTIFETPDDNGHMHPVSIYPTPIKEGQEQKTSYMSVAINFDSEPTDKQIEIIIRRAKAFVSKDLSLRHKNNIIITNFRIIKIETITRTHKEFGV